MKKFLVSLVAMTASLAAFAQTETTQPLVPQDQVPQDQVQQVKPYKVYCRMISYVSGIFTSNTTVEIDFGQQTNFWESDRELVNEYGEAINFNNIVDALNYMGERGWELVEEYYNLTEEKPSYRKHYWILCKTVTSPEQITEGLMTSRMRKGRN